MKIPYATDPRSDTGVSNSTLGMWLFLASEAMLFGALFSSFALLRGGSSEWPRGPEHLSLPAGLANTAILLASSFLVSRGRNSLAHGSYPAFRRLLWAATLGGTLFLAIKGSEYFQKLSTGITPASSTFFAIYFVLTGIHAVHVLGGIGANIWFLRPRAENYMSGQEGAATTANLLLYWYFVDAIWLLVFGTLYML